MNNDKTLESALCAAEGAADTAQAAPAAVKKKYVPPTMQVIPLDPQRMLATSVAESVKLMLPVIDYYLSNVCAAPQYRTVKTLEFPLCTAIETGSLEAVKSTMVDNLTTAAASWYSRITDCGGQRYYVPIYSNEIRYRFTDHPSFNGVDWDAADFFARASFDNGCAAPYTGTYNGQRFSLEIGYYQYCWLTPDEYECDEGPI
ncbi:MAG: hypothetical protein IJ729_06485 [Alloprevotella sp.]|nr:hypothetical protein [Alloprevotella sp.]